MRKYINGKSFLFFVAVLVITNSFTVGVQFLKGELIDNAVETSLGLFVQTGFYLLGAILLQVLFTYLYFRIENSIISEGTQELKNKLFNRMIKLPFTKFNMKTNGEYMARYTNEVQIIQDRFFKSITMLVVFGITVLSMSVALFILNWKLAFITLLLLTMPLYVPKLAERKLRKVQGVAVSENSKFIEFLSDTLRGFEIIKNFSIESVFLTKFKRKNEINMIIVKENMNTQSGVRSISMLMSYFSYFVVVAYAAYLVATGVFSIGELFIAIGLVEQLSHPIIGTAGCIQGLISVKEISNEIYCYIESTEDDYENKINKFTSKISYENLNFSFDHTQLLENINLAFEKGKKYLIKGYSGSGKTTLINLLLKYNQDYQGEILIDNVNLRDIDSVFNIVTVSRQDSFVFADSIRNNVSSFKKFSDSEIIDVLNKVELGKYADLEGLSVMIGEGGIALSGGELKRLMIARAILSAKDILIFDEPLANLDRETSVEIENLLLSLDQFTVIVIGHNVTTSKEHLFDEIYNL